MKMEASRTAWNYKLKLPSILCNILINIMMLRLSLNDPSKSVAWNKFSDVWYIMCGAEPPEPPPKTYTTKGKFDYFKPCVQVEMDNPDKLDTVTEVYIRGRT